MPNVILNISLVLFSMHQWISWDFEEMAARHGNHALVTYDKPPNGKILQVLSNKNICSSHPIFHFLMTWHPNTLLEWKLFPRSLVISCLASVHVRKYTWGIVSISDGIVFSIFPLQIHGDSSLFPTKLPWYKPVCHFFIKSHWFVPHLSSVLFFKTSSLSHRYGLHCCLFWPDWVHLQKCFLCIFKTLHSYFVFWLCKPWKKILNPRWAFS